MQYAPYILSPHVLFLRGWKTSAGIEILETVSLLVFGYLAVVAAASLSSTWGNISGSESSAERVRRTTRVWALGSLGLLYVQSVCKA